MPRPRFHKLAADKQSAILETASKEFIQCGGYHATSYNKIMEKLGISKGAMYYYFEDKFDLFQTVAMSAFKTILDRFWQEKPNTESTEDFWASNVQMYFNIFNQELFQSSELALYSDIIKNRHSTGEYSKVFQVVYKEVEKFANYLMESGMKIGAVRTDCPLDLVTRQYLANLITFESWYLIKIAKNNMTLEDYYNSQFKEDVQTQFKLIKCMLQPEK